MDGFLKIVPLSELADRRPREVQVDGFNLVVVRADKEVYAFENRCPHQQFSLLHQGVIDGCTITCPMHGWTFDMESGAATNGNGRLKKFDLRCSDGWIWIQPAKADQSFPLF